MIDRHALLKQTLQRHRCSITRTRIAVYDAIKQNHQIRLAALLSQDHGADRASVYRTVDVFEKLHIIQRFQKGKDTMIELTGAFSDHHHHLYCIRCGLTIAIPGSASIEAALLRAAVNAGFAADTHIIEVNGLCAGCQTEEQKP